MKISNNCPPPRVLEKFSEVAQLQIYDFLKIQIYKSRVLSEGDRGTARIRADQNSKSADIPRRGCSRMYVGL